MELKNIAMGLVVKANGKETIIASFTHPNLILSRYDGETVKKQPTKK